MSLPEQSLPTSVQRKHVDVFDRDAETNEDYLGNHIFSITTGSVPSFLL